MAGGGRKILTDGDWDLILNGARHVTLQDGECIIRAGAPYQKIYYILRGQCRVDVERDGEMITINHMTPGTTFGEMSFINCREDQEYAASASVFSIGEVEVRYAVAW